MNDSPPSDPPPSDPPAPPAVPVRPAAPRAMARSGVSAPAVSGPATARARMEDFCAAFARIRAELTKVIIGQTEVIDEILVAIFAGGHVLIEGVPGTGKTLMVRTLGQALNLSFNRIQFTIDLMPADITGTRMLLEEDGR